MDAKMVLVQALSLMYWESRLEFQSGGSIELLKEVVTEVPIPEQTVEGDRTKDIIVGFRGLLQNYIAKPITEKVNLGTLLQRIRVITKDEISLYHAFADSLVDELDGIEVRKRCILYTNELTEFINTCKFQKLVKTWFAKHCFAGEVIDVATVAAEMVEKLEHYIYHSEGTDVSGIAGIVDYVDIADTEKMEEMFKKAQEESSAEGVLKIGWQGLTRMFGWHGGMRRGDFYLVGALQHNYKSGLVMNLTKQVALYNTPYMLDPKKKPLILVVSAENSTTDNMTFLYSSLVENASGEPADLSAVSYEVMTAYVKEALGVNGYHFHHVRVNPSDFGYQELFSLVMTLEAQGFEIHLLTIDYLNMFSKKGCTDGASGQNVRDLFRRLRNFAAPRKITVLTPHQISTEAKYLLRSGVDDFVREIANKGYWDSCKTIDQEVDMEILIHIVKLNGKSYLTVQRGKHRGLGTRQTPENDLYTVLPFYPVGGIRDDIHSKDLSMSKVGGGGVDGEGAEWFAA